MNQPTVVPFNVEEEVQLAAGDAAEAAYWTYQMLIDPTQKETRLKHGYQRENWSERDAFKEAFNKFAPFEGTIYPTQDPKYAIYQNKLINATSHEHIPADEPIFLFRARDWHALNTLKEYWQRCRVHMHTAAVMQRIKDFELFKNTHPERMKEPDTEFKT